MGGLDENYNLKIKVKNEGKKTIRDYRFDVLFPNDFLNQHTIYGIEVTERRTETHNYLGCFHRIKIIRFCVLKM